MPAVLQDSDFQAAQEIFCSQIEFSLPSPKFKCKDNHSAQEPQAFRRFIPIVYGHGTVLQFGRNYQRESGATMELYRSLGKATEM